MLLVVFCVLGLTTGLPLDAWGNDAVDYLCKYGYLDESIISLKPEEMPIGAMSGAIAKFQEFSGLKVTGVLDDETKRLMKAPRCGNRDVNSGEDKRLRRRKRRYVLTGCKWNLKDFTYGVLNYPSQGVISQKTVREELDRAFQVWSEVTPLTFTARTSGEVVMQLMFGKSEHGDGQPFDGKGNVVAHAKIPRAGGDTHFDDDEYFTAYTHRGTNLFQTAAHEFGHALGLAHSKDKNALMAPFYRGYVPDFKLDDDDIKGIQRLYGKRSEKATAKKKTEGNLRKSDPALCKDPTFDAIYSSENEDIHVFKGTKYYLFDEKGLVSGYPKLVQSVWKEVPKKIDAVLHLEKLTIFFSGSQAWVYSGTTLESETPSRNLFPGIPNNIDAILAGASFIMVIKDNNVHVFDAVKTMKVIKTFKIPTPPGTSKKVTSVLFVDGVVQFFCGNKFYAVDPQTFRAEEKSPPYPWASGPMWFACKK